MGRQLHEPAAIFLVAVLPLLVFLRHHDYPLVAAETLLLFGLVLAFTLVCQVVVRCLGTPAYVAIMAFLATVVVDVQTEWVRFVDLRLVVCFGAFAVMFRFLRRSAPQVPALVGALMVLATLVSPGAGRDNQDSSPAAQPTDDARLPFVLHLILDAHIGVEGIPAEFDPDGRYAARLRDFYLENSFAVYGRAYSRYARTRWSVPNALRFSASPEPDPFLDGTFHRGMRLRRNAWFDLLHDRGYRIHVLESDYLRYSEPGVAGVNPYGDTHTTYASLKIRPLAGAPLSVSGKLQFILGTYFGLSRILTGVGAGYAGLAGSSLGEALHLPPADLGGFRPGTMAAIEAVDEFTAQLAAAGPGQAFFAHIMLPHSPYGLAADCGYEESPRRWYLDHDRSLRPRYNTDATRALRYPLYLAQMECLLTRLEAIFGVVKAKGLWDEAVIIVHGDHGSRLSHWQPRYENREQLTAADLVDCYSTLFAMKGPGVVPGYYRQLLPVDRLLAEMARDGRMPDASGDGGRPTVFLQDGDRPLVELPLPEFAFGRVVGATP